MTDPELPLPDRMLDERDPSTPDFAQEAVRLTLIAGALAASVVVYAGIAWFFTSEAVAVGFEPSGLPGTVSVALAVAAVALLLIAPVVERKLRERGRGAALARAVADFRLSVIVGFALREAAVLLGLLIALLTGDPLWCFGLSALALIAMAAAWPSRGKLEAYARGAVAPA